MEILAVIGILFLLHWISKTLNKTGDFFIALGDSMTESMVKPKLVRVKTKAAVVEKDMDDPYLDQARSEIEEITKL